MQMSWHLSRQDASKYVLVLRIWNVTRNPWLSGFLDMFSSKLNFGATFRNPCFFSNFKNFDAITISMVVTIGLAYSSYDFQALGTNAEPCRAGGVRGGVGTPYRWWRCRRPMADSPRTMASAPVDGRSWCAAGQTSVSWTHHMADGTGRREAGGEGIPADTSFGKMISEYEMVWINPLDRQSSPEGPGLDWSTPVKRLLSDERAETTFSKMMCSWLCMWRMWTSFFK